MIRVYGSEVRADEMTSKIQNGDKIKLNSTIYKDVVVLQV